MPLAELIAQPSSLFAAHRDLVQQHVELSGLFPGGIGGILSPDLGAR